MFSYSELEIFGRSELGLLKDAIFIVAKLPDIPGLRCHELARVVGNILNLEIQDGYFGMAEHSWLWTSPMKHSYEKRRYPNILDVYAVGSLPQVQLIDMGHWLPHTSSYRFAGKLGQPRIDIDYDIIDKLEFLSKD
jgi:hypothetical protein